MNQPLLDAIALAAGAIVVIADRRRAVTIAGAAAALGLSPAAVTYGGGWALLVVLGAGASGAVAGPLAGLVGARIDARPGLDPLQPVGVHPEGLFGPRSIRVAGAAVALLAASWISFNVPVGSVPAVDGALFPIAFVFACGVVRLFLARNLTDVAVGVAAVAVAMGVGWLLRGGSSPLAAASGVVALAPLVAGVEGWLVSRSRPPATAAGR